MATLDQKEVDKKTIILSKLQPDVSSTHRKANKMQIILPFFIQPVALPTLTAR